MKQINGYFMLIQPKGEQMMHVVAWEDETGSDHSHAQKLIAMSQEKGFDPAALTYYAGGTYEFDRLHGCFQIQCTKIKQNGQEITDPKKINPLFKEGRTVVEKKLNKKYREFLGQQKAYSNWVGLCCAGR